MSINDFGIELLNNKSHVIENLIDKSHEEGIKIVGDDHNT
jgi:GH35 family endo-1,4-beta-xylanase